MNILSHLPGFFQIFSIFCWCQHCLISIVATFLFLLHHVIFCLLFVKCIPGFNPWLYIISKFAYFKEISRTCHISDDVIKKLMTSQRIYMHHTNPIVLKLPCAKFHISSCSQTKVKVGGAVLPPPHPKMRFRKPTRNRVKWFFYDKFYFLYIFKKKVKKKFLRKNLGPWGKMTSYKKCGCHHIFLHQHVH